jgi:hypothetical protein
MGTDSHSLKDDLDHQSVLIKTKLLDMNTYNLSKLDDLIEGHLPEPGVTKGEDGAEDTINTDEIDKYIDDVAQK